MDIELRLVDLAVRSSDQAALAALHPLRQRFDT
jgi:hypothetical protein